MINKLVYVLLFISLAAFAIACENDRKEKLLEMQRVWNSQSSANYSYMLEKQCFCSPDYTRKMQVFVVDGDVAEALYLDTKEQVSKEIVEQLSTITQWFDEILIAIDNEFGEVEIFYNEELGYPNSIKIDKHKRRSDDEFTVIISNVSKK